MAFYLFDIAAGRYRLVREVSLAGAGGPLLAKAFAQTDPEWEMSEWEILRRLGVDEVSRHAIVVDSRSEDYGSVALHRLRGFWGYLDHNSASIAIELEMLTPEGKRSTEFNMPRERGERSYQFLVLRRGKSGTWTWARSGAVSMATLWEHVLDSFLRRMNQKRAFEDGLPSLGHDPEHELTAPASVL